MRERQIERERERETERKGEKERMRVSGHWVVIVQGYLKTDYKKLLYLFIFHDCLAIVSAFVNFQKLMRMLRGEASSDEEEFEFDEKEAELERLRKELERERRKEKRRKEQVCNIVQTQVDKNACRIS